MRQRLSWPFVILAAVAAVPALSQQDAANGDARDEPTKTLRVPTAREDVFIVTYPEDWRASLRRPGPDIPPTVELRPPPGTKMTLMMTFLHRMDGKGPMTQQQVDELVDQSGRRLVGGSVEQEFTVTKIERAPGEGFGSYVRFTDASLVGRDVRPTEYRVIASCVIASGNTLISASVLADSFDEPAYIRGLELLSQGLKLERADDATDDARRTQTQ